MGQSSLKCLWALFMFLAIGFGTACTSYGVDYSNGGAYNIDGSSNQYFSFVTIFQGCDQESISPVLIGPDNNQYACSAIRTEQAGVQVTSTCGIPFSAMKSGNWKIILSGTQVSSQRTFSVTVGTPETTWVTATPTVVVGVTTTARASTVLTTIVQTQTLIIVPRTITAACSGPTRTVTSYPQAPTATVRSTVTRTATDGQITSYWTTIVTTTAKCNYPTRKRDVAATPAAQVAAITSTYTQTTYTVTRTTTTTVAGRVTTETVLRTTTATVTPPPSTACVGNAPGSTVTVIRTQSAVTETNVVYLTSHLSGTVWVGQTQYTTISNPVSATACWRAGGWYGK